MGQRRRQRGATFAETIIVLSVLVGFLGAIGFFHRALATKMDVQQGSRRASLYFASHHCSGPHDQGYGSELAGVGSSSPVADPANIDPSDEQKSVIEKGSGESQVQHIESKSSRDLNLSYAQREATVTGASVSNKTGQGVRFDRSPLSTSPSSESWVYCNEEPLDGNPVDLAKFYFNFFQSGVL